MTEVAAVIGTQIIATLIAVYGIFMAPIGCERAGLVWTYAFAWFLVNDHWKLVAYAPLTTRTVVSCIILQESHRHE
jgi:hypothetical protein